MSTGNIWAVAGAGLVALALLAPGAAREEAPAETPAPVAAPAPAAPAAPEFSARTLTRAADGHFYVEAQVNGAHVRFIVDTGASVVALTPADARRAGIALPSERARAIGAGGEIEVIPVTIERIALGQIEARNVRGAVAEDLPASLLGQSFLGEIGGVEIRGDRMILR